MRTGLWKNPDVLAIWVQTIEKNFNQWDADCFPIEID